MSNITNYVKTRNVAIILTIILLVLGSIAYFSTNVASRNNEMMYKEVYGENATIGNIVDINSNITILNINTQDVKTVLA